MNEISRKRNRWDQCKSFSPPSCESLKIWKCSGHGMPEKSILWIIEKSESVFSQRNPFHQMSPFNGPSVIIARSAGLIHFYQLQQRSEMVGIFFSCAVNIYDQIGFLNFLKLSPICDTKAGTLLRCHNAVCSHVCVSMCASCLFISNSYSVFHSFQFLSFLLCFMHFRLDCLLHVIHH